MPPIMLDKGLVNSRDASLLAAGELAKAEDCYYKPGDPALWVAPGRETYNTTPTSVAIKGIRYLSFQTRKDLLVVHVGDGYLADEATDTGTFGPLVCGLECEGDQLESVQFNTDHLLMNGCARTRVIRDDLPGPTAQANLKLGMLAATDAPTVANTGGGIGITLTALQNIYYWVEERFKEGSTIVKRSASDPTTVVKLAGPQTAFKPEVTRPAVKNSDATHWALFATSAVGNFPVGAEIGEATISTTKIADTRTGGSASNPIQIPSGPLYETIAILERGISLQAARNGEPPISSIATIHQDRVVANDVANPSHVRFTWAGEIHKWPAFNLVFFPGDIVRGIRSMAQHVVILTRDGAWRMDYLPSPEDASFRTDELKARIPGAPGVVNSFAHVLFNTGNEYWVAYVSPSGLIITNGVIASVLTEDLDWPGMVELSRLSQSRIVNNKVEWRLEISYPSLGNTTEPNDKVLFAHYHPSHLKPGSGGGLRTAITGPIDRPARDWAEAVLNEEVPVTVSTKGQTAYINWRGVTDPVTLRNIRLDARTGRQYAAGIGNQSRVRRVWIHHNESQAGISLLGRIISHNEGQDDSEQTWTVESARNEANNEFVDALAEAFTLGVQVEAPAEPVRINYLAITGDESGEAKN